MKLYFTGADSFNDPQPLAELSVGGNVSSTEIDFNQINSLFPTITQADLQSGKSDLRVIAIKNDEGSSKDLVLYYENNSKSPVSYLKMSIEAVAINSCSEISTPTQSNGLEDARGEENAINITIPSNGYKTLFIQRNISKSLGLQYLSCTNLYNNFIATNTNQISVLIFNSNPVDGDYILLYTQGGNSYVIYYGTKPTEVTGEFIKVTLGSTAIETVTNTYNKLLAILGERGEITLSKSDNVLTITQSLPGPVTEPVASFATIQTTLGTTSNLEEIEDIELVLEF